MALQYAQQLRRDGIKTEVDHAARSFKAQFKYADKLKAAYVAILGEEELNASKLKLKNMSTGTEELLELYNAVSVIEQKIKELD